MGRNRKTIYDKDTLMEILYQHKEHLTSVRAWNEYSKEHGLPHAATLMNQFGSWNNTKVAFSLEESKPQRPFKYSAEGLMDLLETHQAKFTTINDWNAFASDHGLPAYQTFERHLGRDLVEEKTGMIVEWNEEKLKKLIKSYFPTTPPTIVQWNKVANEFVLPKHTTIVRHFNSWSIMKARVYYAT